MLRTYQLLAYIPSNSFNNLLAIFIVIVSIIHVYVCNISLSKGILITHNKNILIIPQRLQIAYLFIYFLDVVPHHCLIMSQSKHQTTLFLPADQEKKNQSNLLTF